MSKSMKTIIISMCVVLGLLSILVIGACGYELGVSNGVSDGLTQSQENALYELNGDETVQDVLQTFYFNNKAKFQHIPVGCSQVFGFTSNGKTYIEIGIQNKNIYINTSHANDTWNSLSNDRKAQLIAMSISTIQRLQQTDTLIALPWTVRTFGEQPITQM